MRCNVGVSETLHTGKRPESMERSWCHQPDLFILEAGGVEDSFLVEQSDHIQLEDSGRGLIPCARPVTYTDRIGGQAQSR